MPTPIDLKVLFKDSVSDPAGLNRPTLPSTAIVNGSAVGGRGNWTGVYGKSEHSVAIYATSPVFAGYFDGDVHVSGDVTIDKGVDVPSTLTVADAQVTRALFAKDIYVTGDVQLRNADVAEEFDVVGADFQPGTVMVFNREGGLTASQGPYDKRVAGVISGAGAYKPGLVLDKQDVTGNRQPVALMGKVFCKVDAQFGPIEVGDLLTTSPTPGHAMRANDATKSFGTVIGKALRAFADGQGLVPILVALQ